MVHRAEIRVGDRIAAGPDEIAFASRVVEATPEDAAASAVGQEGPVDEILLGLAGNADQVPAQRQGLCLGLVPRTGSALTVVMVVARGRR